MPVAQDHAAIQPEIPGLSGGHSFNLRRDKVLFLHVVLFLQNLQQQRLDRLLLLSRKRPSSENQVKILRFARHLQKQREGERMFDAYRASYRNQFREEPPFLVTLDPAGALKVVLPAFLTVQADAIQRIPLRLDERLTAKYGKGLLLNYWFSDEEGGQLSTIGRTSAALDTFSLLLPVATPASAQQCLFHLRVIPENGDAADGTIWSMIV